MIKQPPIQNVQFRLAQHYLNKLTQAESASRRGNENRAHWLHLIRQDWEQIRQWQSWSAGWREDDLERARLCAAFLVATSDILKVQLTPTEHLSWAQQALEAARQFHESETERVLLYQAGFLSLTIEVLDQADEYAHQLMERAQAASDALGLGRAWYLLGTASFTRGLYDRAEACYTKSITQFEACDAAEEIPIVWRGLGRVSHLRGDYQQAQTYLQRYLDASTATGNEQGILDAHVSLSGVFLSLRDYSTAERHAQRAVAMARPLGNSRFFPPALFSLAHAQKWLGNYESACMHYEEGIEVAHVISSPPSSVANGLYGLGQAKYLHGDYLAAVDRLEEALEIARSARLVFRVCQISHDMVFVHLACNDLATARTRLQEALGSAQQLGTPHFMAKALAAAIAVWFRSGNPEQAAEWVGLLRNHSHQLQPTLFNPAMYDQLEAELGLEDYQAALERGKALTLDQVVPDILNMLTESVKITD